MKDIKTQLKKLDDSSLILLWNKFVEYHIPDSDNKNIPMYIYYNNASDFFDDDDDIFSGTMDVVRAVYYSNEYNIVDKYVHFTQNNKLQSFDDIYDSNSPFNINALSDAICII